MRRIALLGLLLALASVTSSCSPAHSEPGKEPGAQSQAQKKEETPSASAARVRVQQINPSRLVETITLRGSTMPYEDVTFAAETPGRVEYMPLKLGDRVKKGQVLARVDYALQQAQREQVRVNLGLAKKTRDRLLALRKEDMATPQQLDQAEAQVQSAKAAMRVADVQLAHAVVRSNLDGIVARKFVDEGEYVGPGSPIVQVVDFSTVKVTAQVPERLVRRVKRGMPVSVRIDALDETLTGNVQVVIPAANPRSRTFELRVEVPNPDHRILVGMATQLSIEAKVHEKVIVVAQDSVVESANGRNVFVARDGVAARRPVRLGATEGDRVVVLDGLRFGDQLVVEGHRTINDGQRLKVITPGTAINAQIPMGDQGS